MCSCECCRPFDVPSNPVGSKGGRASLNHAQGEGWGFGGMPACCVHCTGRCAAGALRSTHDDLRTPRVRQARGGLTPSTLRSDWSVGVERVLRAPSPPQVHTASGCSPTLAFPHGYCDRFFARFVCFGGTGRPEPVSSGSPGEALGDDGHVLPKQNATGYAQRHQSPLL